MGSIHTAHAPLHTSSPRITPTTRPASGSQIPSASVALVATPTPAGVPAADLSALPFGRWRAQPAALFSLCAHVFGFSLAGAQSGRVLSAGASADPGLRPI